MHLTIHSRERILERTVLSEEEVRSIIEANAFISLGTNDQYEYLLFHSPKDNGERIAITDRVRAHLITVWLTSFHLPPGISKVNQTRRIEARRAYRKYRFSQITIGLKPKTEASVECAVSLEIYVDNERQFNHTFGPMPFGPQAGLIHVLPHIGDDLARLWEVMERNRGARIPDAALIRYRLSLFGPNGREGHKFNLSHYALKKRLKGRSP